MEAGEMKKSRNNLSSSEDRISELPDAVIHNIFSFLDTRLAVQTCIFSKRWRNMWTSLPYLQFTSADCKGNKRVASCTNFIQQVLLRRDYCPIIELCLESNSDIVCSLTESLVCYAVKHHVRNLKLNVNCKAIQLPDCFSLASKSIQVLELAGSAFRTTINWIKLSQLSSLKTLHISGLCGFDGKFLSSCPSLENLKIDDLFSMVSKEFNIYSLSLKTLEINSRSDGNCVCSLMVPKLTHFKYRSWYPMHFSVKSSVSLEVLDIHVTPIPLFIFDRMATLEFERFIKLFKAFQNAKSIVLYPVTVKVLSTTPDYLKKHPSSFPNLKYLKLRNMHRDFNVPASVLLYFLNSSTILSVSK